MSRTRTFIAASSVAAMIGMTMVAASGLASASPTPPVAQVAGSAVPFTSHAAATGAVASGQKLSVQVWLRPQLSAAESFAAAVSTPGSAAFHRYLSPASYAARFGASAAEAAKVGSWLRSAGFTGVQASPLRSYVRATGRPRPSTPHSAPNSSCTRRPRGPARVPTSCAPTTAPFRCPARCPAAWSG